VYPACHCGGEPCDIKVVSVGSEIAKGKKFEFCSVLNRKGKFPDNARGLQWSFFYICVTQMVEWRKSESAGCNKLTVVEALCCRNASVRWQKREECLRAHTAFRGVLHHSLCQLPASHKKRCISKTHSSVSLLLYRSNKM